MSNLMSNNEQLLAKNLGAAIFYWVLGKTDYWRIGTAKSGKYANFSRIDSCMSCTELEPDAGERTDGM